MVGSMLQDEIFGEVGPFFSMLADQHTVDGLRVTRLEYVESKGRARSFALVRSQTGSSRGKFVFSLSRVGTGPLVPRAVQYPSCAFVEVLGRHAHATGLQGAPAPGGGDARPAGPAGASRHGEPQGARCMLGVARKACVRCFCFLSAVRGPCGNNEQGKRALR